MAKESYLNAAIFTDIVGKMAGAATECSLDRDHVFAAEKTYGTETMEKLSGLLEMEYENSMRYGEQASIALPNALLALRDSILKMDKEISDTLEIGSEGQVDAK